MYFNNYIVIFSELKTSQDNNMQGKAYYFCYLGL